MTKTDISRMSIGEYIEYRRSGESTRDAQRDDATKRISNLATGTCRTCGNPCIPRPGHLCGYCRQSLKRRHHEWTTCAGCGRRCIDNPTHRCSKCRSHHAVRKD